MQDHVSTYRSNEYGDAPHEHSTNASRQVAWIVYFTHDFLPTLPDSGADSDANTSFSLT
jgi:hypothetical protein